MTSLATKAAKRLVLRHARVYEPQDPFYEEWVDSKGSSRRRKRPPPPGLTAQEAALLRKIQRRAHYLDKGFSLCGIRFGWTAIIGLIPGAGDIADASLNYFLVLRPAKKGAQLPDWLVHKMLFNNVVSAGVGLIPIAGDIVLAIYKANSRNAKLLEEYLRVLGEEHIAEGLPNLTPAPPALPGGQLVDPAAASSSSSSPAPVAAPGTDTTGPPHKPHPAQPAAQRLVRDHSDGRLVDEPHTTASQRVAQSQQPTKRRFW